MRRKNYYLNSERNKNSKCIKSWSVANEFPELICGQQLGSGL
jgi:hypothetical protein